MGNYNLITIKRSVEIQHEHHEQYHERKEKKCLLKKRKTTSVTRYRKPSLDGWKLQPKNLIQ